jgi:hypothetical protein
VVLTVSNFFFNEESVIPLYYCHLFTIRASYAYTYYMACSYGINTKLFHVILGFDK